MIQYQWPLNFQADHLAFTISPRLVELETYCLIYFHLFNFFTDVLDPSEGSWSMLGSICSSDKTQPTMFLDLSDMTSKQVDTTIMHQFGHALGLGHALLKKEDWDVLKDYVDGAKIRQCLCLPDEQDFEMQWTGHDCHHPHHDIQSVMLQRYIHYITE